MSRVRLELIQRKCLAAVVADLAVGQSAGVAGLVEVVVAGVDLAVGPGLAVVVEMKQGE